jgi:hypothetical protein
MAQENPLWERAGIIERMKEGASALGLQFELMQVVGSGQIEHLLTPLKRRRNYALYVFDDQLLRGYSAQIIAAEPARRANLLRPERVQNIETPDSNSSVSNSGAVSVVAGSGLGQA